MVATSVADTVIVHGADVTVPSPVVDSCNSLKNTTRAMAGPETCVMVTVLGLTLSITKGDTKAGEMTMLITGPLLSMRTTLVDSMTLPPTSAATLKT